MARFKRIIPGWCALHRPRPVHSDPGQIDDQAGGHGDKTFPCLAKHSVLQFFIARPEIRERPENNRRLRRVEPEIYDWSPGGQAGIVVAQPYYRLGERDE